VYVDDDVKNIIDYNENMKITINQTVDKYSCIYEEKQYLKVFKDRNENEGSYLWIFMYESDMIKVMEIDVCRDKNRSCVRPFYLRSIGYLFEKKIKIFNSFDTFEIIFGLDF